MPAPAADHVFHRAEGRPVAVRAYGSTIVTADGHEILDGAAGAIACSVGHGHPDVIAAMTAQATQVSYVHAHSFETEALHRFATHVATVVPVDDARVFPVSGGSEANESAIKLARAYHLARGDGDRHVIIAREASYHGNSRGALDASHRAALTAAYEPWLGQTVRVPQVNPYRDARTGEQHAAEIDRVIREAGPGRVAAFLAEPISGATLGAVVPPDDYWPAVVEVLRSHGVLLVMDEVMTGFGRTGRWFGSDHWGVRPDMITSAKGVSSGYWPLGLCIASGSVYDTVTGAGTFSHGFTWSHHPVGAAVGDAVLTVIERDGLVERSATAGAWAKRRLIDELAGHPNVGEVRGRGLMIGVELVADRVTKAPFDASCAIAERVTDAALVRGLTVYTCNSVVDGSIGDAVLLGPPLIVTDDELDAMVTRLVAAIRDVLPV
jgi:adenosylmethionine-8-amino-7-oxononanoate aminotransferase